MTRAFARALGPGARIVGVERDDRQRAAAADQAAEAGEADLAEFRAGDAAALPLARTERGAFDLAHARFLLEHVPDPLAVVREMVSAVRPGGRIVLVDDDHEHLQLWPECPEMERLWRVYWEAYRDHGFDPVIGRRMMGLLTEAGAQPHRVTSVFYGACRGMDVFDAVVDNLIGVIRSSVAGLALERKLSRAEIDEAFAAFARWRQGGAATVWYSLPMAEGVRGR
jgi:SAM-dependent methyltransferase